MTSYEDAFRRGLAPQLSDRHLKVLARALREDDYRLIQCATTSPPPLWAVSGWPVEAACPIGYMGWIGDGLKTVAEVEDFFVRVCFEIDLALGEPAACRFFLVPWDETPRAQARQELLELVEAEQQRRLETCRAAAS